MKRWFLLSLGLLMFSSFTMANEVTSGESSVASSSERVVVREIARHRRRHRRHRRHHRRHHRHHYRW